MLFRFPFGQRLNSEGELAAHKPKVNNARTPSNPETFSVYLAPGTGQIASLTAGGGAWGAQTNNIGNTSFANVGGNQPHNNLPPLYALYRFRRIK